MAAAPVPFTLLGGYLGAGKTTLVNRLLATTDRRLVVLVNDVGAINVDVALIASHDGETLTLSNGCVCCAIADDLGPALERVRELAAGPNPPEQVIMELSGVAEPARVAPTDGHSSGPPPPRGHEKPPGGALGSHRAVLWEATPRDRDATQCGCAA